MKAFNRGAAVTLIVGLIVGFVIGQASAANAATTKLGAELYDFTTVTGACPLDPHVEPPGTIHVGYCTAEPVSTARVRWSFPNQAGEYRVPTCDCSGSATYLVDWKRSTGRVQIDVMGPGSLDVASVTVTDPNAPLQRHRRR